MILNQFDCSVLLLKKIFGYKVAIVLGEGGWRKKKIETLDLAN